MTLWELVSGFRFPPNATTLTLVAPARAGRPLRVFFFAEFSFAIPDYNAENYLIVTCRAQNVVIKLLC